MRRCRRESEERPAARWLRAGTYTRGGVGSGHAGPRAHGCLHERVYGPWPFLVPIFSTIALGAASNALEVSLIPDVVRKRHQARAPRAFVAQQARRVVRPPAWRAGAFGARGRSAFRATEAALGVAASELFAALPKAYREQLADLPATVEALEARAAEARAEAEVLAALAPSGTVDADMLRARREKAASNLAESVAALEGIRLDLLRLHAGAGDLAPLNTLMDAARLLGEDVRRLAEAQREVEVVTAVEGAKRPENFR